MLVKRRPKQAIQFHMREFADEPLVFDDVPKWLDDAVVSGVIRPEFRTEDYWYLIVQIDPENDPKQTEVVGPGDWLVWDARTGIEVYSDSTFKDFFEKIQECDS